MKDETALTIIIFAIIFACAAAIAGAINVHDEHEALNRHQSAAAAIAGEFFAGMPSPGNPLLKPTPGWVPVTEGKVKGG